MGCNIYWSIKSALEREVVCCLSMCVCVHACVCTVSICPCKRVWERTTERMHACVCVFYQSSADCAVQRGVRWDRTNDLLQWNTKQTTNTHTHTQRQRSLCVCAYRVPSFPAKHPFLFLSAVPHTHIQSLLWCYQSSLLLSIWQGPSTWTYRMTEISPNGKLTS